MTHEITTSHAGCGAFADLLRAWWLKCRAKREARIATLYLKDLPDYLLRDIGLTRDKIPHAMRHRSM